MDKEKKRILERFGYNFEKVKGLYQEPRATYYRIVKGEVMECHNLPADAHSMEHYLAKGFTLTRPELKPQTDAKAQEGEFVCQVCGESFSKRIALIGHSRKHKNK